MRLFWHSLLSASLLAAAVGCGGGTTASQVLKHPELPTDTQSKCRVLKSQAEPLIVEWPDTARAKLESLRKRGLVAVHYEGCELEVLSQCRVKGAYSYSGVTAKQTTRKIQDADELYASLPLGAVKFEGKLQSAGQLNVDMTLVGRFEAPSARLSRGDLEGECDTATHVIAALSVGAFTFSAGSDAAVGASVGTVAGASGGGKSLASPGTFDPRRRREGMRERRFQRPGSAARVWSAAAARGGSTSVRAGAGRRSGRSNPRDA